MGIKTGNTVKFDYTSSTETKKPSSFQIQKIEDALYPKTREQPSDSNYCYPGKTITIKQSVNKNKAWEVIDDLKNDSNFIVEELESMNSKRDKKKISQKYTKKEENQVVENTEEPKEVIVGRKGKTLPKERPKGKKGVNQNKKETVGDKKETEAETVVYVHKTQPKDTGVAFKKMYTNYSDDYGNKNPKTKRRRELSKNCDL